ncbi:uncharacterized protein BO72DRAFT_38441 [Aspergillus fijiensis CBS 313.89]|uniref:Ecp2 effector protein domain-containing protein n=1 Tax=Aspergillus fijiensis CBS 313.89 TaxID=1448319 RepID=A0A8G1VTE2_9EURO|nr:uncharacterized protein BO72DRAFT_38441 [Aspergillus fijiensis CBS 313.89]RAK70996.1 hypothetical protein BO72DRAFT_38441 [Aspergillus fijiensis CBS 313.89]
MMSPSTIAYLFSTALAVLTPLAAAKGCYSGGESYSSVATGHEILEEAVNACDILEGIYVSGASRPHCSNFQSGNRVNWEVTNESGSKAILSSIDCVAALRTEIEACPRGSLQTYGPFLIKYDPNAGAC